MQTCELEELLGGFTKEEMVGVMEKHHIVYRSHGGCDYYYNIIELPTGFHHGSRGPHLCKETDLLLKRDLQENLFRELGTGRKTKEEIVHLCCPMNRRSREKLFELLEYAKNHVGMYEPEDAVRAIMGGKLY